MADSQIQVLSFTPTEKGADVLLSVDTSRAATLIDQFFVASGFWLEEGTSSAGVYGKGNKVARAILGGWVKREKYNVSLTAQGEATQVTISSGMSGWSGSAIGRAREKKGRTAIVEDLRTYLAAQSGAAPGSH
ncbi:MAG TPA: hypothetical protein VGW79_02435 [Actinomycetota bacterium]|nr:hypothetical protein [Actinomycetota bacterium]